MKRIVVALVSCAFWLGVQADEYFGTGSSAAFDLNFRGDLVLPSGAVVHGGGA